jgi:hypothetical protein
MNPPPGKNGKFIAKCDPIKDFNSPQTLIESIIALAGMYFACYMVALFSMKMLSRKYQ